MKNAKADYTVNADGWIAGQRVAKGDKVSLSEEEAKYENVSPVKAAKVSSSK